MRFLIFTFFLSLSMNAQVPTAWIKTMGNGYAFRETGDDCLIDWQGNILTVGVYSHEVDFDPGPGEFILDATPNSTSSQSAMYLQKLDADGHFLAAFSSSSAIYIKPLEMKIDDLGNVYIIGRFRGNVDFDIGPEIFNISSAIGGNDAAFIMKLDADLNFLWAKRFGSAYNNAQSFATDLTFDENGNIYLFGTFYQTFEYDGETMAEPTRFAFLLKANPNGDLVWMKKFGTLGADIFSTGIQFTQAGNLICTGYFEYFIDFDPGPGVVNDIHSNNNSFDLFILNLSTEAEFLWVKTYGGPERELVHASTFDGLGNIYLAGTHEGNMNFTSSDSLTLVGDRNIYLAKFDSNGDYVWAKSFGNKSSQVQCMASTHDGNVYLGGVYEGEMDFDPSDDVYVLTAGGDDEDAFIGYYSLMGDFSWATSFGSTYLDDWANDIYATPNGPFCATGSAIVPNEVEIGPHTIQVQNHFSPDSYILKSFECNPSIGQDSISGLIKVLVNGVVYDTSGSYIQSLTNFSGCDSTLYLDVSIQELDTATISQNEGFSNNETDFFDPYQGFTIPDRDNPQLAEINVYPNPFNDFIQIDFTEKNFFKKVELMDIRGKIIFTKKLFIEGVIQLQLNVEPGIYFLKLIDVSGLHKNIKIVKV